METSRVQLALNVSDIDAATRFYTQMFGVGPAKQRAGYANFEISDPPLKLVLFDSRENSATAEALLELTINEAAPALVQIPSGIWHGFQAIKDETFLLHLNSEPFQFDAPDEERIPPDDPRIPYRWS